MTRTYTFGVGPFGLPENSSWTQLNRFGSKIVAVKQTNWFLGTTAQRVLPAKGVVGFDQLLGCLELLLVKVLQKKARLWLHLIAGSDVAVVEPFCFARPFSNGEGLTIL